MRADFLDRSKKLYTKAKSDYAKRRKSFTSMVTSFDLDPSQVLIEQSVSDDLEVRSYPVVDTEEAYDALPMGAGYSAIDSETGKLEKYVKGQRK